MNRIAESISDLAQLGATTYHDLTGRLFQTLITDRKFLATFYTLPESACLLAELAVERLDIDWSDRAAIGEATDCGLCVRHRSIALRRAAGRLPALPQGRRRNDKDLHRAVMERVLTGLDIMPAATHLTCSMLSSSHPSLAYGESQIHTMPYGIEGNRTHIGALDLLDSDHSYSLFATGESMGGTESESRSTHSVKIEDKSCDLVIMNPPFTRPTRPSRWAHRYTSQHPLRDSARLKVNRGPCQRCSASVSHEFGHGNAGLASNFMDLGHRKLKAGGVIALVLPFAFTGVSRGKEHGRHCRRTTATFILRPLLLPARQREHFPQTPVWPSALSWRRSEVEATPVRPTCNLTARPSSLLEASVGARNARCDAVQDDILDAGAAGVLSMSVIEAARDLETGNLRLPRHPQSIRLPIVTLGTVAARGL